jgi:hypothetical protein
MWKRCLLVKYPKIELPVLSHLLQVLVITKGTEEGLKLLRYISGDM